MGAATKTNIPMRTENLPRIATDFDNDLFSENIKRILLLSKKCDGQVRDEQISVPVISTIVAMLLGTNSGVALQ